MRKIDETPSFTARIFSNRVFLFVWVLGCIIIGVRLIRSSLETKQAFLAKQQAEEHLKQEEKKGVELMDTLQRIQSPLEQERRIREDLNMQKPGEIILQLPSPTP